MRIRASATLWPSLFLALISVSVNAGQLPAAYVPIDQQIRLFDQIFWRFAAPYILGDRCIAFYPYHHGRLLKDPFFCFRKFPHPSKRAELPRTLSSLECLYQI